MTILWGHFGDAGASLSTPGMSAHALNADNRDWFRGARRSQPIRRIASVTRITWPTRKMNT